MLKKKTEMAGYTRGRTAGRGSTGGEKVGSEARKAHGGYRLSWGAALDGFAGKFSGTLLLFDAMSGLIDLTRGRARFVRNSLARMPDPGEAGAWRG